MSAQQPPILVSACLTGLPCRYDGGSAPHARVFEWHRQGRCLAVCPELLGGLPCPRPPCERQGDAVYDIDGRDVTGAFQHGAALALERALAAGCRLAVLKARSPSCGVGLVYDGTFSGTLTSGNGLFADALCAAGLTLLTDEDI